MPGDVDIGDETIVIQDAAVARICQHALEESSIVNVFCGGWRSRTVSITIKRPSAVRIK